MKKKRDIRKFALLLCTVAFTITLSSQAVGPGKIEGGFGIDGDLAADTALHGAAAITSGKPSDDWFRSIRVKNP